MCPYATEKKRKRLWTRLNLLHYSIEYEKRKKCSFPHLNALQNAFHHWVIQVTFSRAVFPTIEQATGRKLLHINLKE